MLLNIAIAALIVTMFIFLANMLRLRDALEFAQNDYKALEQGMDELEEAYQQEILDWFDKLDKAHQDKAALHERITKIAAERNLLEMEKNLLSDAWNRHRTECLPSYEDMREDMLEHLAEKHMDA